MRTGLIMYAAAALLSPSLALAQLNVLISGGFSGAYQRLLPEFERANGLKVTTGSGASQGSSPQTIKAQLARGIPADVVILSREGLAELIEQRRIVPGTDVDLAIARMGIGVRAGAPKPDLGSPDAFKRALTSAKLVVGGASTSGIWLDKDLLPRLGIRDKVNLKLTPRTFEAARMVVAGEAEFLLVPVSEILNSEGIEFAGPFPAEYDFPQTFAVAIVQGTKQSEAAKRLIAFLTSPQAAPAIRQSGMEPAGPRAAQ